MDKINFNNSGQPAINDINLNQMQDNIEKSLYGEVVYSNNNGSGEEITFSKSIIGVKFIDVEIEASGKIKTERFYNPVDKTVGYQNSYWTGALIVTTITKANITTTKITPVLAECGYFTINTTEVCKANKDNINYNKIKKVIAYF